MAGKANASFRVAFVSRAASQKEPLIPEEERRGSVATDAAEATARLQGANRREGFCQHF